MATELILRLPAIKTNCESLCVQLNYFIDTGKSWGHKNLENLPPAFQDSMKNRANDVEVELGRLNMCMEQLDVSRKILENCLSNFDEYVLNSSSIPSLEQLSARAIKENPDMVPFLPRYIPTTYLRKNVDEFRTHHVKTIKSRRKKKSKSA